MNLSIDLGNTRAKLGLFDKEQLVRLERVEELNPDLLAQKLEQWKVKAGILSSVVDHDPKIEKLLQDCHHHVILTHKTRIPITNRYSTPETLGRDRLSSVIGANHIYPNRNILVIDAGTCIKFDFIDKDANYLGGAISPGIWMRLKAMHHFTDKLPMIPVEDTFPLIGDSTKTSLQSGALSGAVAELNGIIGEYEQRYDNLMVMLTGGDASFFESKLKNEIFAVPNLVLTGLNKILNFNAKPLS